MISTNEIRRLSLHTQVFMLFELLYSTRKHPKTMLSLSVTMPQAIHRFKCPMTRHGDSYGPCDCGGDRVTRELDRVLHALKKTVRFEMREARRIDLCR